MSDKINNVRFMELLQDYEAKQAELEKKTTVLQAELYKLFLLV